MSESDSDDFWSNRPEELSEEHLVFSQIKAYTEQVLSLSSITQFDRACDVLLDPSKDISPLLLHYD